MAWTSSSAAQCQSGRRHIRTRSLRSSASFFSVSALFFSVSAVFAASARAQRRRRAASSSMAGEGGGSAAALPRLHMHCEERKEFVGQFTQTLLKNAAQRNASNLGGGQRGMVRQHKSWDDILLEEREENSRLRQQQRDQAERERRLVERLTQLKEQQSALQQGKTVDAVGRDGKIKALQVRACTPCPRLRDCRPAGDGGGEWRDA